MAKLNKSKATKLWLTAEGAKMTGWTEGSTILDITDQFGNACGELTCILASQRGELDISDVVYLKHHHVSTYNHLLAESTLLVVNPVVEIVESLPIKDAYYNVLVDGTDITLQIPCGNKDSIDRNKSEIVRSAVKRFIKENNHVKMPEAFGFKLRDNVEKMFALTADLIDA